MSTILALEKDALEKDALEKDALEKDAINGLISLNPSIPTIIITILDWDNTLFPMNLFESNPRWFRNHSLIPNDIKIMLNKISQTIISLISSAKKYGPVAIISNGTLNWIKKCMDVIPEIIPVLDPVFIISAQDNWKHRSDDPEVWKKYSFNHTINHILQDKFTQKYNYNIISIGDSMHEYYALIELCSNLYIITQTIVSSKIIKYIENPTIDQLLNQLTFTTSIFENNLNDFILGLFSRTIQFII